MGGVNIKFLKGQEVIDAAKAGNHVTMAELIREGYRINAKDEHGCTPLHLACTKGYIKCVNLLLHAGADIKKEDKTTQTALRAAAKHGSYECVKALIRAGADVNNESYCGFTALHSASWYGHDDCVEYLIKSGADVKSPSKFSSPPIVLAAMAIHKNYRYKFHRCVQLLVEAGADIDEIGDFGTALASACTIGDYVCVDMLLNAGADVNKFEASGYAPLIRAAMINSPECIQLLLKAGVHVNHLDKRDSNSLTCSIYQRVPNEKSSKLLFAAGEILIDSSAEDIDPKIADKPILKMLDDMKYGDRDEISSLKHMCRTIIREHLIKLDKMINLYHRIPKLNLPAVINDYLLYHMSLELNPEK